MVTPGSRYILCTMLVPFKEYPLLYPTFSNAVPYVIVQQEDITYPGGSHVNI